MIRASRLWSLLIVALAMLPLGARYADGRQDDSAEALAARLEELSDRLFIDDRGEPASDEHGLDTVTRQLWGIVDAYAAIALGVVGSPDEFQARMRSLLHRHEPASADGQLPVVYGLDRDGSRFLVLAASLTRPPHHDVGTMRAYRSDGAGRWTVQAVAGEESEGSYLRTAALPSPHPGELWLLASRRSITGNGRIVQVRVIAFDGTAFRTIWAPDAVLDPTIAITERGLQIGYVVRRPPFTIEQEYTLAPDGVRLLRSND